MGLFDNKNEIPENEPLKGICAEEFKNTVKGKQVFLWKCPNFKMELLIDVFSGKRIITCSNCGKWFTVECYGPVDKNLKDIKSPSNEKKYAFIRTKDKDDNIVGLNKNINEKKKEYFTDLQLFRVLLENGDINNLKILLDHKIESLKKEFEESKE